MTLPRRKLLVLAAASMACLSAAGSSARASLYRWTGTALGADAEIRIAGLDRDAASRAVTAAVAETERLEAIFSLYRPDSELSRLNRDGELIGPSQDFRLLLERSLAYWKATDGAFNPAIQPVWRFLARHFETSTAAPEAGQLHRLLEACDPAQIFITPQRVALRPGMGLTFNGIAQGYVTDCAADLLRQAGLRSVLVNLGELRALAGRSWRIGVAGRDLGMALADGAVAQSSGRGTLFTADGRWHHLIDPHSGESANFVDSLTVAAANATQADALSTALFVTPPAGLDRVLARFPGARLV
jgi:thiamine biosynthesis lipoprotein